MANASSRRPGQRQLKASQARAWRLIRLSLLGLLATYAAVVVGLALAGYSVVHALGWAAFGVLAAIVAFFLLFRVLQVVRLAVAAFRSRGVHPAAMPPDRSAGPASPARSARPAKSAGSARPGGSARSAGPASAQPPANRAERRAAQHDARRPPR